MTSAHKYMSRPTHEEIDKLANAIPSIPTDPTAQVTCVDCGKLKMAIHCVWSVNMKTGNHTGPHCGCKKSEIELPEEKAMYVRIKCAIVLIAISVFVLSLGAYLKLRQCKQNIQNLQTAVTELQQEEK